MIEYKKGLKDLINNKLNANDNGIIFNTDLENSKEINYFKEYQNTTGYGVTKKRIIPTMITSVIGDFLNIPNISATDNTISLEFDLCIDNYTNVRYEKQDEYKSVDYSNTLSAIDNLRQELLAQYHPLGDKGLRFGGGDSTANINFESSIEGYTIYIDFVPKDKLEQNILTAKRSIITTDILYKDDENIMFDTPNGVVTAEIPYTPNQRIKLLISYDGDSTYTLKDLNGDYEDEMFGDSSYDFQTLKIGRNDDDQTNGFSGIIYELSISNETYTSLDDENTYNIILADFESKDTFVNQGTSVIDTTNEINNCILWGSYGNAIFAFETLVPVGDIVNRDDGQRWQLHALDIRALVSNDILFGNNFEYTLTIPAKDKLGNNYDYEVQIYPVDRQHTYKGNENTYQRINATYGVNLIQDNANELTKSFFYDGSYELNTLLKHVVQKDITQNQEYTLNIQYPFFNEDYTVLLVDGGISPNINEFATLTVSFKEKDTVE